MQPQALLQFHRVLQRRRQLLPIRFQRRRGGIQRFHSPVRDGRRDLHMPEEPAVVLVVRDQARADARLQRHRGADAEGLRHGIRPPCHPVRQGEQQQPQGHQQEHGQRPPRLPPRGPHQHSQACGRADADPHAHRVEQKPVGIGSVLPDERLRARLRQECPIVQVVAQHPQRQQHGGNQRRQVGLPRDPPAHVDAAHGEQRRHQDHRDIIRVPAPAGQLDPVRQHPVPHVLEQQQKQQQSAGYQDIAPGRRRQQPRPHAAQPPQQQPGVQRSPQDDEKRVPFRPEQRGQPPQDAPGQQQEAEQRRISPQVSGTHVSPSRQIYSQLLIASMLPQPSAGSQEKEIKKQGVTVRPRRSGNTGRKLHHPLEFPGANFLIPYFSTLPAFPKRRKITGWYVIYPSRPIRNSDPM